MAAAPCQLLVEPARNLRAAYRVVAFEDVASEYQSGVRSEKNPDYDAAQARVRGAERGASKGGPGVLRVGDPMLDLVGLLVGGVIATFGDLGDGDLDDALAALKETPRSRDRPVYRAYQFERSTVRAGKEATVPIALSDLRRGRIWRTELRQREMREFAVLEGLNPRDPDYEQHRAGAFSWREFEHWQREPPKLPLSAMVAALVEPEAEVHAKDAMPLDESGPVVEAATSTAEPAASRAPASRLAAAATFDPMAGPGAGPPGSDPDRRADERVPLRSDASDARSSPQAGENLPSHPPTAPALTSSLDPRVASVVRLEVGSRRGNGFYVKPRLVVTAADVVGTGSVVDVTTSDGERLLGLVVLTDPTRNLAVVHVPRAGRAAPFAEAPAGASGRRVQVVELAGDGHARVISTALETGPLAGDANAEAASAASLELEASDERTVPGAPVFLEDRAIGLVAGQGARSIIGIAEVQELLQSEALIALH